MKIREAKKLVREVVREKMGYSREVETIPRPTTKPRTAEPEKERKYSPLTPPQHAPKPSPKGMFESEKAIKEKITKRYENLKETSLSSLRKKILSEISMIQELSLEQLKQQWVDSGKMKPELFDEIVGQTTKPAYVAWLIKNVSEKAIQEEDVYKWGDYIKYFDRFKVNFPKQDINQYKGRIGVEELQRLITTHQTERAALVKRSGAEGEMGKNLISPEDIRKLAGVRIKFLGSVDGYQVFEVPQSAKSEQAYKVYKNTLGRCKNGDKIHICTVGSYEHYLSHLEKGTLYVFFNLSDPLSPYQFHYETNQFKDKNNNSIV